MSLTTWELIAIVFMGLVALLLVRHWMVKGSRAKKVRKLFDSEVGLHNAMFRYNEAEMRGKWDEWRKDNMDVCPEFPCNAWDNKVKNELALTQDQWDFMKGEMSR